MPRTLHISALELYNKLQAQKNWPSGGAPALLDLRPQSKRIIRGAVRASLKEGAGGVAAAAALLCQSRRLPLRRDARIARGSSRRASHSQGRQWRHFIPALGVA